MYKTIIDGEIFTNELYRLANQYPRMFDIHEAITWELGRNPLAGEPVQPGSKYRTLRTTRIGPTPVFTVLYLFDDANDSGTVYLYSIRLSDND